MILNGLARATYGTAVERRKYLCLNNASWFAVGAKGPDLDLNKFSSLVTHSVAQDQKYVIKPLSISLKSKKE